MRSGRRVVTFTKTLRRMLITPMEGLGVPAVRSELEGSSQPTIEAVVGRRLLGVTASDFEASKALVPKAAARLH